MDAFGIAGFLCQREITGKIWGVIGPLHGQVHGFVSGCHTRVWLNNGYGILLLDDDEPGKVNALYIRHLDGETEDMWEAIRPDGRGPWWTHDVSVEHAETMLTLVAGETGRMNASDHMSQR